MTQADLRTAALIDGIARRLAEVRPLCPEADYHGRLYFCDGCEAFCGTVAPLEDLVDNYRCPDCSKAMTPVVPPGIPLPARATRKARKRSGRRR